MSHIDRLPLHERAHGRWFSILTALGVPRSFLTKRNGPCPMCGGKDRWRWTDHQGSGAWICNHCGHGSGVDLVKLINRVEFKQAAELVEGVIGKAEPARQQERSPEELRAAMREAWSRGRPVTADCPTGRYLTRRIPGLSEFPRSIRSVPSLRYDGNRSFPAMISQVIAPDGSAAVNLHRTWLTEDGRKAPVEPVRKMMPGPLPKGSAIRLAPAGPVLGIAEGIETALAASVRFKIPVWSLIAEGNLQGFRPPAGVEELRIFGDNDLSMVGQAAAFVTARDVQRECQRDGRTIRLRVLIPDAPGADWADAQTGVAA
ncbi:P4 alpha zinc-binding domain protein [uncultured Gammaproteobacteria bacterium]